jgi:peptidoglycan-N-acetylglucosamine deacetylase
LVGIFGPGSLVLRLSGQKGRSLFAFAALAGLLVASPTSAADGVAIIDPRDGAFVSGQVVITAAAPPETTWVEFSWSVDGVVWNRIAIDSDGANGWQAVWDSRPSEGAAKLRATASGGTSAIITVTVDNTAPVVSAWPAPTQFSPNGDGRKDETFVTVAVPETALVDIRVRDRAGKVVGVLADDLAVERGMRVAWNGRSADGARAPDGAYRLVVEASDAAGNTASRAARVRLDTTAPRLTWRSRAGIVGAASLKVSFRMHDASAPLGGHFRLVNAYDRVVRTWQRRLSRGAGSSTLPWRTLRAVVPGVYRLEAVISDAAGNRASARPSPAYRVDHSARTRVVARVNNAGPYVALTFDDCYFPSSWESILRTLARNRVKAAFFCPGNLVRTFPALAARTVRAGHTIGSHGWDHALLPASGYGNTLWRLKRDRNVWWSWREAAVPYFRPPYGAYNSAVLSAAATAGYRYTVLWDVDTRDWTNPGPSAIVSRAVNPATAGSIILLHVKPETARALPLIIRRLRNRGLTPISLEELIHRRGAISSRGGWSATSAQALEPAPAGERSTASGFVRRLLLVRARIRRVIVASLGSHSDRGSPAGTTPFTRRSVGVHGGVSAQPD